MLILSENKTLSLRSEHTHALAEIEKYKLLVESVEDYAIFMLDTTGHIRTWNKGAVRNKGYQESEIIGKHFSVFYLQDDIDAKKPQRELEIALRIGRVEDEDWRVRKDGSRFWANVVITALFDASGNHVGFAKVTRDLSERKHHEDELRQANTLLRKQQQELTALNEAKDEFISLASHQLRTPATAIKQLLGVLLEGYQGDVPDAQLPLIQKAYDANDRQISIVNSLLQVAQIDAGKVILRKSSVDISELLQDVIDEQADTVAKRRQTVRYERGARPHNAEVDQKYLRMALENIVDNASKYTPSGGTITIDCRIVGRELAISVIDTGVGIPEEQLPNLFQKFVRISNELSQKVSGSGLGLYWVREVIQLHGGRIAVTSKPGEGTAVTLYVPKA